MKPTVIRIVDDDSDVCDSLSCLLSLEGWEIRIYTEGISCWGPPDRSGLPHPRLPLPDDQRAGGAEGSH